MDLILDPIRELAHRGFALKVEGLEHLPAEGPALIVGNHNGGIMPLDSFFTALAIRDHFGVERELNVLGHDLLGSDEVGKRVFTKARGDPRRSDLRERLRCDAIAWCWSTRAPSTTRGDRFPSGTGWSSASARVSCAWPCGRACPSCRWSQQAPTSS